MKYVKLTTGNVVIATVEPLSEWIDEANNRSFIGEGYIEIEQTIQDRDVLKCLYDSSAEEQDIKTMDSFTYPTTDANGNERFYNEETGVLEQYTYSEEGYITGKENA
ncbi:MAG: hypothetical protein Unbinned1469contig1000_20 [Prokaryotic dsDNA virus sp.]|jgi:hypothetical protein|nr:MAG: hypothetical protein Unbinned1469contig1000_20 [Prokaryotic dsDNA virus sp.]|tara:strand:+ start:949 stop:1269 length:321 start_codon:yes stop_codon:yes gene_type:complete